MNGKSKREQLKGKGGKKKMIMQVMGKNEEGRQGKAEVLYKHMGAFVGQIIDCNVMCLDLVNLFPGNHCLKV